jgi:general secretion pathway protein D
MPLVLRLLQQKKGVDVLTTPKVTTLSQQEAKIEIIREFRYATAWDPGKKKTDKWTPAKFAVKNIGVTLSARPTVTEDGKINLWFEPVVTEFEGFTDLGQGRQKPNFTERRAQTTVALRDGQTVILSGGVREDTQKVEDKVPVLGDIPLLGGAFRSKTTQTIQRRLVVFVTPRIVEKKPSPTNTERRPAGVSSPANTSVVPPLRD